jgi:hypothetical protein
VTSKLTTAFAVAVLGVVAILIVPLPPPLLDALLALNVFGSALVLLISLRVEEPLVFSAFAPSLLLATLFRLALDVSATRLILTQGHEPGGAGALIPAFGQFVVRGNVVVGLIVFAILITIQFVVIASGAQRGYYTTTPKRPDRISTNVRRAAMCAAALAICRRRKGRPTGKIAGGFHTQDRRPVRAKPSVCELTALRSAVPRSQRY